MIAKVGDTVAYWWYSPDVVSRGVVKSVDRTTGKHVIECQRKKRWELGKPERRRQCHEVFHAQVLGIEPARLRTNAVACKRLGFVRGHAVACTSDYTYGNIPCMTMSAAAHAILDKARAE